MLSRISGCREGREQDDGENCLMRSFLIVLVTNYHQGDQIKEDETCGTSSTHEIHNKFGSESIKGRDCLGDLSVDGMIILKCTLEILCDTANWIFLP